METTLRYELSNDGRGLKKWFRKKSKLESFYHVHSDEMTDDAADLLLKFKTRLGIK